MNSITGMTVPKFQAHQSGLKWLNMPQELDFLMLCMKSLNTITTSWLVPFSPLSYASPASAATAEELRTEIAEIEEADAEIDRGEFLTSEELEKEMEQW